MDLMKFLLDLVYKVVLHSKSSTFTFNTEDTWYSIVIVCKSHSSLGSVGWRNYSHMRYRRGRRLWRLLLSIWGVIRLSQQLILQALTAEMDWSSPTITPLFRKINICDLHSTTLNFFFVCVHRSPLQKGKHTVICISVTLIIWTIR